MDEIRKLNFGEFFLAFIPAVALLAFTVQVSLCGGFDEGGGSHGCYIPALKPIADLALAIFFMTFFGSVVWIFPYVYFYLKFTKKIFSIVTLKNKVLLKDSKLQLAIWIVSTLVTISVAGFYIFIIFM